MRELFRNTKIDFVGNIKKYLIALGAVLLVGIVILCVFGVHLDINFKGGSRYSYTFSGEIDLAAVESAVSAATGNNSVDASISTDYTGQTKSLVISMATGVENESNDILKALKDKYPSANFKFADSNTVGASIAGTFFAKSIV